MIESIAAMTNTSKAYLYSTTTMRYVKMTIMLSTIITIIYLLLLSPKFNFFKTEKEKFKPPFYMRKSLKTHCVCETTKCVMQGDWLLRPDILESDRLEIVSLHKMFSPKKDLPNEENLREDEFCGPFYDVNR